MYKENIMKKISFAIVIGIVLTLSLHVFALETLSVNKNKSAIKYFNNEVKLDAYNINGSTYLKLRDVSNLFNTDVEYKNNTIFIGDISRANVSYYTESLSGYPNLEDTIGLPLYEINITGNSTDFKFVTKNVSFKDMVKKIDAKLREDGFSVVKIDEYKDLIQHYDSFNSGKSEYTYIKYTKDVSGSTMQYAIQIIDGGVDKNNLPIIIIRMSL